jgi:hypothetical protein
MTSDQLITFTVTREGQIERAAASWPAQQPHHSLIVTVAPTLTSQATARLLRRLADELEGATL